MSTEPITYVECPRDAWQGMSRFIPTDRKRAHLEHLIEAGFGQLDLGSFVSPAAVPQLADTEEVLLGLNRPPGADFLCIVANRRGVERARAASGVTSVGYPLSVSDTFQRRNVGMSLEESWSVVEALAERAEAHGMELVVYLSMGFGNPYGDPWTPSDTASAVARVREIGIERVALADTVGTADAARIGDVLAAIGAGKEALGLHLHARPDEWHPLVEAGLDQGIRWFEGAFAGAGGCPFADDELVGNLPTEEVLPFLRERGFGVDIDFAGLGALRDEAALLATRYA